MGRRRARSLITATPICTVVAFCFLTFGDVSARSISIDIGWRYVNEPFPLLSTPSAALRNNTVHLKGGSHPSRTILCFSRANARQVLCICSTALFIRS